jgi:hypothetical protein
MRDSLYESALIALVKYVVHQADGVRLASSLEGDEVNGLGRA